MKPRRPLRVFSWAGLLLAAIHAAAFVSLYSSYRQHAGRWFADLPLVIFSWPFAGAMNLIVGGSFDYAGDMTARVVAAGLTDTGVVYLIGWTLEAIVRAIIGAVRRRFARLSPG